MGTGTPINGMILLSTNDFTRATTGAPMINATARATTGDSFKNQENSATISMLAG